eukprot:UN00413
MIFWIFKILIYINWAKKQRYFFGKKRQILCTFFTLKKVCSLEYNYPINLLF